MEPNKKIKLRVADIKAAPIPASSAQIDYHFDTPRGLTLRVSRTGKRSFYVLARMRGGKMIRQKIGDYPNIPPELAKTKALELLAKIAGGDDPTAARRTIRGAETLLTTFELFLTNKRSKKGGQLAPKTQQDYRDAFYRYCSAIKTKKLPEITSEEINKLYLTIGKNSPAQANKIRALLSSIFSWAAQSKLIQKNPVTEVSKAFTVEARDRFMSREELRRFFDALNTIDENLRDFFLLALFTGARRSNLQEMQWSEINFDTAIWYIAKTKNGTAQNVALSPECIAILTGLRERANPLSSPEKHRAQTENHNQCHLLDSPYVFPGSGKTGHLVEPKKTWASLLKNAKITNLRIHDLRRTLGSWQAISGASLPIIGKSLNQTSLAATQIYARLDLDPVRASVQAATNAMLIAAGMKNADQKK